MSVKIILVAESIGFCRGLYTVSLVRPEHGLGLTGQDLNAKIFGKSTSDLVNYHAAEAVLWAYKAFGSSSVAKQAEHMNI